MPKSDGIEVEILFVSAGTKRLQRIARTTVEKRTLAERQNLPVFKPLYLQP